MTDPQPTPTTADIVAELRRRGLTLAVAESLTGGRLVAELVGVPGVSAVLHGGVVAYATQIKRDVVGVDAALLAERGAVDAEVAAQLAERVRAVLAVDGRAADVGVATTGVAGPDPQDGQPPGTVFIAIAMGERTVGERLRLDGDREAIRGAAVSESLALLGRTLGLGAME